MGLLDLFRPAPAWKAYDAGAVRLWIADLDTVDAFIRRRAHGEYDQRTDKIRGVTDFTRKEIFCVEDVGIIAHELRHFTLNTFEEGPTEPINDGAAPIEPPEPTALFEERARP
jgi:hypothetical protein